MPTIKEFVEALQAGWYPALVALLGCSILVAGNWYAVPYLANAPDWLTTTGVVVGVFAFSILIAKIFSLPMELVKWFRRRQARRDWRLKIEQLVQDASEPERSVLAYLITTGRQAFAAKVDNRRLVPLVAKGFILRLSGQHDLLAWPFLVQEDVWQHLRANKEMFVFEDADIILDPFYWRNEQWI